MPSVSSCLKIVKMNIAEIIREFAGRVTTVEVLIFLIWLFFFGSWLVKTSWGRNALAGSLPRRHDMPFYLPFIPLIIWYGTFAISTLIAEHLLGDLPDWQDAFVSNLMLGIGGLAATVVIIFLAGNHFSGRLKGFGLNPRVIHKDFGAALLNLLFVWPLLVVAIILTTLVGKVIWGQDFHIQQHEELELLRTYSQLPLRVLIFIIAAVIAPVLEESLFRGVFHTMKSS
jgi:membrane protease YdiL (CAAX protease family)